jgi:hypothetical protein
LIGRSRLDLITRLVLLGLLIPMTVVTMLASPHEGHAWIPMIAVGLVATQRPNSED